MVSMRALECLVTIVEQGSLTKAAAVLHMSQPALSHQIAAIERELGTPVIERLPRGIRPTAAGLAAEARIALAAADRGRDSGPAGGGRDWWPHPYRLRGDDDGVGSRPGAAYLAAPVP
jgi:DNA-binding transcriptional LysR family regulator